MAKILKPMKGPNEILPFTHFAIRYPQLCSTKYDGFRMLSLCGEHNISPNLKPIRNKMLGEYFKELFAFLKSQRLVADGELWSPIRSFHEEITHEGLSSILTTYDATIPKDIGYYIFDLIPEYDWDHGTEKHFSLRYGDCMSFLQGISSNVIPIQQYIVETSYAAEAEFDRALEAGHEGIILRQPNAGYKHGRCTANQDGLWKFKEFVTFDGKITAVEEQMKMKEGVERTFNPVGELERRYEQDLYEPAGMIGSLQVMIKNGTTFKIKPGKGFDNSWKRHFWELYCANKDVLIGKHVEYKFMPHGSLNRPRIGSLVRFRPDLD